MWEPGIHRSSSTVYGANGEPVKLLQLQCRSWNSGKFGDSPPRTGPLIHNRAAQETVFIGHRDLIVLSRRDITILRWFGFTRRLYRTSSPWPIDTVCWVTLYKGPASSASPMRYTGEYGQRILIKYSETKHSGFLLNVYNLIIKE